MKLWVNLAKLEPSAHRPGESRREVVVEVLAEMFRRSTIVGERSKVTRANLCQKTIQLVLIAKLSFDSELITMTLSKNNFVSYFSDLGNVGLVKFVDASLRRLGEHALAILLQNLMQEFLISNLVNIFKQINTIWTFLAVI